MGGGSGGGNTTTTQKADPWEGVQPYLANAYAQAAGLYAPGQGPAYYPGQMTPDTTWQTTAGLKDIANTALSQGKSLGNEAYLNQFKMGDAANNSIAIGRDQLNKGTAGMYDLAGQLNGGSYGTANAMNQLTQAGDFGNNPAFQAALSSAIRPVTQNFQEQVMPAIQQGAQAAGQMGGSRQGIAEGIAARGYQDTVGDISANMGNQAYAQGLQALQSAGQLGAGMTAQQGGLLSGMAGLGSNMYGTGLTGLGQNLALTGGVQQAGLTPGQAVAGVGAQYEGMQQDQINANMAKYNYGQNLPYTMISDYLAMLNGAQGGSTTAQQSGGGSNRAMGALGGAASGAAMGTAIAPGMGTAIGAGAGALYGLFM